METPLTSAEQLARALVASRPKDAPPRTLTLKRPKFKPLVLSVEPSAAVRRVGGTYECFIGGERVQCGGAHSTPDKAWLCLARYIAARMGGAA